MERIVTRWAPARTHDLLRVREPSAVTADAPAPPWVEPALKRSPWVVVRRGCARCGRMPVGVRGATRSQRFAAWVSVADVVDCRRPEELWGGDRRPSSSGRAALAALGRVAPLLARSGCSWGPAGSVGFELATGVATANESSDLDIILRHPNRLDWNDAKTLYDALAEASAPVRIDVLVETPQGGVLLADLVTTHGVVLVRTLDGPRLTDDPWAVETVAFAENV